MSRFQDALAWIIPFTLLVVAVVAVPVRILDEQGLPRYQALKRESGELQATNERLQRELASAVRDVDRLRHDPGAIEQIARDELGMVHRGEIVFQFPQD